MVEVTIDGQKVEVPEGSMVMHAAHNLGLYVPHFCYHKKLSIAANCRMCLVEVEKAPKPMPACATPVTAGMVVHTRSEKAVNAQKGVMEFLLINHPLDCPICDQGGECQLQDLAVGYGASNSRYTEEKRVVFHKNLGPLVAAEEMTRCIHCTRCVRFGQEIAGQMELGMANRGEHSEITSFLSRTITSELSGNMIDLCPVGALTSKPFRYSARTWELARRKSVSPHDSLGSNLIVQVKQNRVMRVLPLENEDVNECWLSDRDRFSYEGLNSDQRLTSPRVKRNGQWHQVDWSEALEFVADALKRVVSTHGASAVGAFASGASTLEEFSLLGRVLRGLGSDNIDFRLRHSDFSLDGKRQGAPWLGMQVAEVGQLDRALFIGSFLRKDHPLLSTRVRLAAKRGAQIYRVGVSDDDWLMPVAAKLTGAPKHLPQLLVEVVSAVAQAQKLPMPLGLEAGAVSEQAQVMASGLLTGARKAVFLGNFAVQHPQAGALHQMAQWLAEATGAKVGFLTEAANTVGGYLAGAMPQQGGLNAARMMSEPRKAYVLFNVEPLLDCADGVAAQSVLSQSELVVALTPYANTATEFADVLLPIAPFTETSGSFVNAEGRVQSFTGTVRPLGETRPGWKVLRVLGNLLGLPGFEYESSEQIRDEVLSGAKAVNDRLSNAVASADVKLSVAAAGLERIADVPIYWTDAIVRRSPPLQATADAQFPVAKLHPETLAQCATQPVQSLKFTGAAGTVQLAVVADTRVPVGAVHIPAGHPATVALGPMFGSLKVEA